MAFSCFPQSPPVWSLQAQEALFPLPFAISHSWEGLPEPALFENSQSAQIVESLHCKPSPWPLLAEASSGIHSSREMKGGGQGNSWWSQDTQLSFRKTPKKKKKLKKKKGIPVSASCWDTLFPGRQEEKLNFTGSCYLQNWAGNVTCCALKLCVYHHSLEGR